MLAFFRFRLVPWNTIGKVDGPNRRKKVYRCTGGGKVIVPDNFRIRGYIAQIITIIVLNASLSLHPEAIWILFVIAIVSEGLIEFFDLGAAEAAGSRIDK